MREILKTIILGIVEGITEWLPISSTGHMLLLDDYLRLNTNDAFYNLFIVVIQLGAIMAVLGHFKQSIKQRKKTKITKKLIISLIPIIVIGLLFNNIVEKYFQTKLIIAVALIFYGVLFIIIESKKKRFKINSLTDITYKTAFLIGIFQSLAIIPGTSRSGVTIILALLIGVNRSVATEYSFLLSVPTMLGASFLKIYQCGFNFTKTQMILLAIGVITSYLVSLLAIKLFMKYIKKHDLKIFGYYRIALGLLIISLLLL